MGWISRSQQDRDHAGLRNICAACGRPATTADPLVLTDGDPTDPWSAAGSQVHRSHTTDPSSGFYRRQQR